MLLRWSQCGSLKMCWKTDYSCYLYYNNKEEKNFPNSVLFSPLWRYRIFKFATGFSYNYKTRWDDIDEDTMYLSTKPKYPGPQENWLQLGLPPILLNIFSFVTMHLWYFHQHPSIASHLENFNPSSLAKPMRQILILCLHLHQTP